MSWSITNANIYKLKLSDDRIVYMYWMGVQGPLFYKDEEVQIDILDWHKDQLIVDALKKFETRNTGC